MWRSVLTLLLTIASCLAIPRASGKRELQQLARLPRLDSPVPLAFDRNQGFIVFPNESTAAAEAAEILSAAKGAPRDAALHLKASQVQSAGGSPVDSIRSLARAIELFSRQIELEPSATAPLIGLADACLGLGRFSEAQAALDKAALLAPNDAAVDLALARLHQEKAWSLFVGEENRFNTASFLEIVRGAARRATNKRVAAASAELGAARKLLDQHAGEIAATPAFLRQRAAFISFSAALERAFALADSRDFNSPSLPASLFQPAALEDLEKAAQMAADDPRQITIAAFFDVGLQLLAVSPDADPWSELRPNTRGRVLDLCRQLQAVADVGSKEAAQAAELLGCTQIFALRDFPGAQRSFRAALRFQPQRARSWDLLAYAAFQEDNPGKSVEVCEDRSAALPNARSSALLIHSYEDSGDASRAEWAALVGSAMYPNDLHLNLCLAALLLRRDDLSATLIRVGDALNIAEKQLNQTSSLQHHLDFVALKSIYLGLSDRANEARALLQPYLAAGNAAANLADIFRALESED